MKRTRRDFIKFIVAGSVVAGCPLDELLRAAPAGRPTDVHGEHYNVCHQVRDGHRFARPQVSRRYDVAILGGGVSGLTSAYFLQKYPFLLLEKESHWGGNAYLEDYHGEAYATGSAFEIAGEAGDQLAREIGLKLLPVNSPDATIVNGVLVEDTWRTGLDQLPYPAGVRESFKKFREAMRGIDIEKRREELDNEPLTKYTAGYAPELQQWWDCYGPSNWGARAADTSAMVAIEELQTISGQEPDRRVTLPGGLGAITKRLAEILLPRHREQMRAGATVVAVEPQKNEVHVTYALQGKLETIAAKAVIMATPKFITSRLVTGLPESQRAAMRKIRYVPYAVANLIFDRPVYSSGYDTWAPGKTFTDFIVAEWVIRKQPGYRQRHNILTFYTPLHEAERSRLLTEEGCRDLAGAVLRDFRGLMPGFNVDPIEVHIYRRGHPMFMSTPGTYTRIIPAARQPMERIFFANADSEGPESLTSGAVTSARRAVESVEKLLASHRSAQMSVAETFAGAPEKL